MASSTAIPTLSSSSSIGPRCTLHSSAEAAMNGKVEAHVALQVWSPSMPRGYNLQSFHTDLKALMLKAGVEGQPVCLFLEDHQLVDPGFLECINSLLSGGEVRACTSLS